MPRGIFLFLFALFVQLPLTAQYFVGFQVAPTHMRTFGSSGGQVEDLKGYGVGIAAWDRDTVGQGNFRFGLDWVQRSYQMDMVVGMGMRNRAQLDLVTEMLYFSADVQIALAKGLPLFFDFGPMIGFQVGQRREGIRFSNFPVLSDTLEVNEREAMFRLNDVRLHIGISGDIPVGKHFRFMLSAGLSCGHGNWAEEVPLFTFEEQVRAGIAWRWP